MKTILLFILALAILTAPAQAYECWKGQPGTEKEGQYGTVQGDGYVPDSDRVPCTEYQAYVDSQPVGVLYEEKLVETTGLDPVTQIAINAVTGAGAAYLVVRKKKT